MKNQQQLTLAELGFCKEQGANRFYCNTGRGHIKEYRNGYFSLQDITAQRLGVVAEAAVFKACGGDVLEHDLEDWAHYVDDPNFKDKHSDLYQVVEVRRAADKGNLIPMRTKDTKPGVIVIQAFVKYDKSDLPGRVSKVYETVELLGWAKSDDYNALGKVPNWKYPGDTRLVPRRPMETLDIDEFLGRTQ